MNLLLLPLHWAGLYTPIHVPSKVQFYQLHTPRVLLIACPFAREYWYSVLHHVGLQQFTPQPSDTEFDEWWDRSWRIIPEHQKKGFNSLVVLGAWSIWTHRNACVFDGATPSISRALSATNDERHLWEMAGARCLFSLTSPVHEE